MIDTLTSPRVLLAVLFLIGAAVLEPVLEFRLNRALGGDAALQWSWQFLLGPLARAAIIAGFVLLAYPALYGVRVAPSLATLLAGDALRVNTLIGILFIVSLLLPLLSLFSERSVLLLPAQALIATAIVFSWFTHDLGATSASLWPGLPTALILTGFILAGHRLAVMLSHLLGEAFDLRFATTGAAALVLSATEMLVQVPVMLLYGYALGQQIAI